MRSFDLSIQKHQWGSQENWREAASLAISEQPISRSAADRIQRVGLLQQIPCWIDVQLMRWECAVQLSSKKKVSGV
jgi:hypothetical protein